MNFTLFSYYCNICLSKLSYFFLMHILMIFHSSNIRINFFFFFFKSPLHLSFPFINTHLGFRIDNVFLSNFRREYIDLLNQKCRCNIFRGFPLQIKNWFEQSKGLGNSYKHSLFYRETLLDFPKRTTNTCCSVGIISFLQKFTENWTTHSTILTYSVADCFLVGIPPAANYTCCLFSFTEADLGHKTVTVVTLLNPTSFL